MTPTLAAAAGAVLVIGLLGASCAAIQQAEASPTTERRASVVFVLLDDATANDMTETPGLLDGARVWPRYTVTTSLCCPDRADTLSGQYSHNSQVRTNHAPNGGWPAFRPHEGNTLAVELQRIGASTGLFGKYLNGYPRSGPTPPGWSTWAGDGTSEAYPARFRRITDRTVAFIAQERAAGRQYFAWYSEPYPHKPTTPEARYADRYADLTSPTGKANALYRDRRRGMLSARDGLQAVRAAAGPDAYVILASDNGFHFGDRAVDGHAIGKGTVYASDTIMPLAMWGPGVEPGIDSALIAETDLAPTIAHLMGASAPAGVDGRDFLAAGGDTRTAILLETWPDKQHGGSASQAIRTERWLYIEQVNGRRELYDIQADPGEYRNLFDPTRPPPDLAGRLARLRACAGDTCRAAEGGQP